jgi:hypothetical protein
MQKEGVAIPRLPRSSIAGKRPGATVDALDQGGSSAGRLARSMKIEDKSSSTGSRPEVLSACLLPV